jgi:stress response protein SCP2
MTLLVPGTPVPVEGTVVVGVRWEAAPPPEPDDDDDRRSRWRRGRARRRKTRPHDVDLVAFVLGADDHVLDDNGFVFYNNPRTSDSSVVVGEDDLGGARLSWDDRGREGRETVLVELEAVDSRVAAVELVVSVHEARARGQSFSSLTGLAALIAAAGTIHELVLVPPLHLAAVASIARLERAGSGWLLRPTVWALDGDLGDAARARGVRV